MLPEPLERLLNLVEDGHALEQARAAGELTVLLRDIRRADTTPPDRPRPAGAFTLSPYPRTPPVGSTGAVCKTCGRPL